MLAQARMVMLKIILPVNDIVKKVYIDSIITTEPLEYNDGWGNLKFEYYSENIEIKNKLFDMNINQEKKV
jgi:ribosomal protein L16/L10AE